MVGLIFDSLAYGVYPGSRKGMSSHDGNGDAGSHLSANICNDVAERVAVVYLD